MNPLRADHISPLDMFKIGVGPSSSHTVGPMVAAISFRQSAAAALSTSLSEKPLGSGEIISLKVELYGSLSLTGKGHQTDGAVCAGLAGLSPRDSDVDEIWQAMENLTKDPLLYLGQGETLPVKFNPDEDLLWLTWTMDEKPLPHPNTMRFRLLRESGTTSSVLFEEVILSVGGGFVEPVDAKTGERRPAADKKADHVLPYPYNSAEEYVAQVKKSGKSPWQIVVENQAAMGLSETCLLYTSPSPRD